MAASVDYPIQGHIILYIVNWNIFNKMVILKIVVRKLICGWSREVPAPATDTCHQCCQ